MGGEAGHEERVAFGARKSEGTDERQRKSQGTTRFTQRTFYPYTQHQGNVGGLGRETALTGKIQNSKICKG